MLKQTRARATRNIHPPCDRRDQALPEFLEEKDAEAAARASAVIDEKLAGLSRFPNSGRPFARDRRLREMMIGFGDAGYVVLYRYEPSRDIVFLLAFRHQRELGY